VWFNVCYGIIDIRKFKRKAVSTHWELMFTRSMFGTHDMIEQHKLLNEVSNLVDTGKNQNHAGRKLRHNKRPNPKTRPRVR
jgi:hypothetical protein